MEPIEPYDWTDDPDVTGKEILDRFYQLPKTPIDQPSVGPWLTLRSPPATSGSEARTIFKETHLRTVVADWRELVA